MFISKVSALKKGNTVNRKEYALTPSQNGMYLMYKFSLHKQQAQIPTSFIMYKDIDFNILQRAFQIEISRNDSLRLRFRKVKGEVKQYFIPFFEYKVPVKHFFSEEEQEKFCSIDAAKPVSFLKDETFRIYFFRTAHNGCGIYSNFSHLIMDAGGILNFYFDLLKVYDSLTLGTDLPKPMYSFEEFIGTELRAAEDTQKEKKHEEFYREYFSTGGAPFYAAVHGTEFLEKYRKKTNCPSAGVPLAYNPLYDKCDMKVLEVPADALKKIIDYCIANSTSPENVFQMGIRTYCSSINYRTEDVSMMCVCGRRMGYKTKNMSGCLAQPLIFRTVISEDKTFSEACDILSSVRTALYRHADYPYTKARDMFLGMHNLGAIQGANNMMFSWIPLPVEAVFPFSVDFRTYNLGRYFTPLYTIITPDTKSGGLKIYYMYRTKLINEKQIEALHSNMLNIIMQGIENPDITVSKLLDSVK